MANIGNLIADILKAQLGDARAFGRFIALIEPDLRRHVTRLGGGAMTDDILQEGFIRAWRGIRQLTDLRRAKPWLFRIVTNEAFRMLRAQKDSPLDAGAEMERSPAPFLDPNIRLDVEKFMSKLTPAHRTILSLHYYEGFSLDDIAEICGAPQGTVRSRLAAALKYIRVLAGATP